MGALVAVAPGSNWIPVGIEHYCNPTQTTELLRMMAIVTKYLGPTDYRGSRVVATADWGEHRNRLTLTWDDALDSVSNHQAAARALAMQKGWSGVWIGGTVECGYVFVRSGLDREGFTLAPVECMNGGVK